MRLSVPNGAPRVPGCAGLARCRGAPCTPVGVFSGQGAHELSRPGRRVLCSASDGRRPSYSDKLAEDANSRGSGSGSYLDRALNKQLQQCKSLDELSDLLGSSGAQLDVINTATAWVQLAKLRPFVFGRSRKDATDTMAPEAAPLVRTLIRRAMAQVHLMTVRELTNCLYSMGRLVVNLEAEPNGHYLAEQVEQRLLELAEKEQGLAVGAHAAQLWRSLSIPRLYPWGTSMVARLVELSFRDMDDWDNAAVGQICGYWGRTGIQLAPAQKELFTQRVAATLAELASSSNDGSDDTSKHVMTMWIPGIHKLGLELPAELLPSLHERLLSLPESDLVKDASLLVQYGMAVTWLQQLGYQPTAAEAAAWERRLLHPPPGARWRLSLSELTNGMATLSSMSAYVPSSDALARAAAYVRDPRGCTAADARRLLTVAQHWRLPCTQAQMDELRRLATPAGKQAQSFAAKGGSVNDRAATPAGSEARTPGGGGTRPQQQQRQAAGAQQQQRRQQQQENAAGTNLPARDPRPRPPPPRPGQQGMDRR